jgi:hypothetical protein
MLMTTHKKTPLSILYTHTKMNAPLRIESRRVVQGVRDDETTTLYGAPRASRAPNTQIFAEQCGYEVSVDERENEACCKYRLVRYNGALGAESPLKVLLRELGLFEEKQVSARALQLFVASSRPTRLAVLAGFGDTDGWRLAVRGMSAAGFSQSLRARHGSIVMLYAVVAASCGFDVAYGEVYDMDTPPRRDDNGVYAFIPNDRVWEDNCFARVRKALSILNGTTSEIPFVLGYKKTPPVDRVIDGQSFVRGFSGFQFRRIRGAAISMTTLTVRGSDRIVLANGLRTPVNNDDD